MQQIVLYRLLICKAVSSESDLTTITTSLNPKFKNQHRIRTTTFLETQLFLYVPIFNCTPGLILVETDEAFFYSFSK